MTTHGVTFLSSNIFSLENTKDTLTQKWKTFTIG